MVVALQLYHKTPDEARKLNWKRMTRDFTESIIDSYIDMQSNRKDKMAVVDMILHALKNDFEKHIHEAQIEARLNLIRRVIEDGVYSPYREIERLSQENDVKDKQITELMAKLEEAKKQGDEIRESELITKIVGHSIKLGSDVARNVELVLGRIYRGTNKFIKHFKILEEYIANPNVFILNFQNKVGVVAPGAELDLKLLLQQYEG